MVEYWGCTSSNSLIHLRISESWSYSWRDVLDEDLWQLI